MKVYSLSIVQQSPAKQLVTECDLSSFSFFQRSSAQEFLNFFVVTLAERTAPNTRQKIEENSKGSIMIQWVRLCRPCLCQRRWFGSRHGH
jgi:hypothetical protein